MGRRRREKEMDENNSKNMKNTRSDNKGKNLEINLMKQVQLGREPRP